MSEPDPNPTPAGLPSRSRPGPILLVVPFLSLVLGVLWARQWRPYPAGGFPEPPEASPTENVSGWATVHTFASGERLGVRLAPLHAEPERQAFDAESLQRRLRLPTGEPWRLALTLERPLVVGQQVGEPFTVDLSEVRVTNADGTQLAPIEVPFPAPATSGVVDPVAVLMTPPEAELGVGEAVHLVLWGRAPSTSVTITGLGSGESVALQPEFLLRESLEASIARLDRTESESEQEQR